MTERFNKVGIRILDDPKATRGVKRRPCLPDAHKWRETGESSTLEGEWIYGIPARTEYEVECLYCGEKDWR